MKIIKSLVITCLFSGLFIWFPIKAMKDKNKEKFSATYRVQYKMEYEGFKKLNLLPDGLREYAICKVIEDENKKNLSKEILEPRLVALFDLLNREKNKFGSFN